MKQFNLKEFRMEYNLTQKQLISKTGIPNVTITQIENGHKSLSRDIRKKIFDAFQIDEKKYSVA
ncbi:MAG TPA: helix-turn-helix transcriptional regulator [Chitinophagaceae bacterium]|nr:helix-turn-helix transcriptional regulator [Chitinophagaceae bacterium]